MKAKSDASDPPRQERALHSRREILRAARIAFARDGYDGTNIRDIAEQVGVTHTLIRYHYGNKEELWKAVVDDMFDRLSHAMSPSETGKLDLSTREGLKAWLRFYIRYCADNPEHVRIMLHESMAQSERLDYMVNRVRRSHKALIPVFQRLMLQGVVPEVWLVSFFYIVSTVCQMPFVLSGAIQRLYGTSMTSEPAIEAHTEAVIALILGERTSPEHWPSLPDWALEAQQRAQGQALDSA
jgi:AcrR family transcriptional regulator